jgi:TadE-like protein
MIKKFPTNKLSSLNKFRKARRARVDQGDQNRAGSLRERGAAVVEAAIVTPLFFLLILSIAEFGPLFFEFGSSRDAVSEGVRLSSIAGASGSADYDTIQSMRNTLKNVGPRLDYVIVYKAASIHAKPPQVCIDKAEANIDVSTVTPVGVFDAGYNTTVIPNVKWTPETFDWGKPRTATTPPVIACNVYYRRMFDEPKGAWVYDKTLILPDGSGGEIGASLDRYYPGTVRIDYQSGPQDFVGIYLQHQYTGSVGLIPPRKVRSWGVVRIEPIRANR